MACIFNTVLLDLSAAMTDSFEGRGAYSRVGGLFEGWLIGGFTVCSGASYEEVETALRHYTAVYGMWKKECDTVYLNNFKRAICILAVS